jgi:hypothetical protein
VSTPTTRLPTLMSALTLGSLALVLTLWQQVDAEACSQGFTTGITTVTCEQPGPAASVER